METIRMNVHSQEYMETMARLMSEALESPEGMRALAAAIAEPIEQEIKRKEISSLLLTKHTLPKGERPLYQKKPKVKAYWISTEGEAQEQEVGKDEVEFPTNRIHSAPMVDVSVLKNGNIGTLMDIQTAAADEIRKEIDKRTITVLSAAVPAAKAFAVYLDRLKKDGKKTDNRKPLPDFLIGAHAQAEGLLLVTRDPDRVSTYFPQVKLRTPGMLTATD